ncbi:MAG: FKBP-type peptidyl-prolyl cis-trans isomerase [Treponema sp.]|jgi:FKBP-type peptidyl-prolyl cis-trans isomerase|nr:FKBP-type peptidyl-prolyl cis-trans isomerase [Treponema sp.]
MKYRNWFVLIILLAAQVFGSCKDKSASPSAGGDNLGKDASYALGMNIGASLAYDNLVPDYDEFIKGIKDRLTGGKMRFNENEAMLIFQEAYYAMMEKKGAELMQKGIEFLAENSKKPRVNITATGLQYEVIRESMGEKPSASDMVRVHYEGRLIDGTVFDSSYDHGSPVEFPLDRVIAGWTEGLQLMSVGSKFKFYIPYELGYGAGEAGPIPPYSTLIFEVELLDIIR